jgi:membrane fusion protein (multidrug efflux system)
MGKIAEVCRMNTRKIALVAGLLVLLAAGVWKWRSGAGGAGPDAKGPAAPGGGPAAMPVPTVEAMVVSPQAFTDEVKLTGQITADESIDVRTEVSGRVKSISFREGGDVNAGQLLVKLVDDDLVARRSKLEQQRQLEVKRAERLKAMKSVDGVSQEDLETAQAQAGMRAAEIAELDAQIAKTEVRAPFRGRVGLRQISVGAIVGPSTPITTLTSLGALNVDVAVPERYVGTVGVGSQLRLRLRSADTVERLATVSAIEPVLDERTRTQRLRARLASSNGVSVGMFADVQLRRATLSDAILVPAESVVQDMNGATVYRVRSGRAEAALVTIGARTMTHVQITSGLAAGDTIVTSGILFVKPGKPVKATVQ